MKVPTYLKNNINNFEDNELTAMTVCSSDDKELFEIWYYGDLFLVENENQNYIVNTDQAPMLIVAKEPDTQEEIILFDGGKHGYDNMFCDVHDAEELSCRTLKKLDIPISKILIELGYSIDYEEEKEDYDFDENGSVILVDGRRIAWETVLLDGFDYIAISFIDKTGRKVQFVDAELA